MKHTKQVHDCWADVGGALQKDENELIFRDN
jgi:hypothetical protein